MLAALASIVTRTLPVIHLGGFFGAIVGLVVMLIVIWAVWSVFDIIAKQFFGGALNWVAQIIRIILIAAVAIWFLETVVSLF